MYVHMYHRCGILKSREPLMSKTRVELLPKKYSKVLLCITLDVLVVVLIGYAKLNSVYEHLTSHNDQTSTDVMKLPHELDLTTGKKWIKVNTGTSNIIKK